MKLHQLVLSIILSSLCGEALAQSTPPRADQFECMSKGDFLDFTAGSEDFRINNFSIVERPSSLNRDLTVLEVAYSVANRKAEDVHVDAQFYLTDGADKVTATATAGPGYYRIGAGETETAKGGSYVPKGTLVSATAICVRLLGDW